MLTRFLFTTTCGLLLALTASVVHADRDRSRTRVDMDFERPRFTLKRAKGYEREVWIALSAQGVDGDAWLRALDRQCAGDITAVVVTNGNRALTEDGGEDEAVLQRVMAERAIAMALEELGLDDAAARKRTRVVLLGAFESGIRALDLAREGRVDVDGVVLIDPPVEDLPEVGHPKNMALGIDLFLHSRSQAEAEREEALALDRLGLYAASARIVHGGAPLGNIEDRVEEVWSVLREGSLRDGFSGEALSVSELAGRLAEYDVIFVGELHGNPASHRLQYELLQALAAEERPLALATEHFERDVQATVDAFLKGEIDETEFLKNARPWPNHADYRPLVELCREKHLPLIAGNIPRRLANRVYKEGPEALENFDDDERAWSARELVAEPGAYRTKFYAAMGATEGHNDAMENMFRAQCVKDDTMAESVADYLEAHPDARVMHINGGFHSDEGLGVPEKLLRLRPDLKIAVIASVEAWRPDDTEMLEEEAEGNDFVLFVPASRPMRRLKAAGGKSPHGD